MVHRAGMVDSMAIVGNIRPAAPPGVWQPSAAPLASAGAPSVVYDADTTDEFDYISRRGKDGLRTITTTSGGQTTTFTAGPGLEQKRGRGWVGTDVMPSPADVEQGLLYRALHPPLPTTSPSTSPAPPNHHPTSFSNDIESIGNDHSTASRPASSASSAAGGGGGFAYGARPMKWAASTNAPLELHDKMTGLRLNRNLPPPYLGVRSSTPTSVLEFQTNLWYQSPLNVKLGLGTVQYLSFALSTLSPDTIRWLSITLFRAIRISVFLMVPPSHRYSS